MLEEHCVPWNPIPEEANAYWNLGVVHLEEAFRSDVHGLVIAVASSWPDAPDAQREFGAWRIQFGKYYAYRKRMYGYAGNLPLRRLDERSACWQVRNSAYLREEAPTGLALEADEKRFGEVRHFVICAGDNSVYEVIACSWHVEALPDTWANPFGSPVPRE